MTEELSWPSFPTPLKLHWCFDGSHGNVGFSLPMPRPTHKNSIYQLVVGRDMYKTAPNFRIQDKISMTFAVLVKTNNFKDFNLPFSLLTFWQLRACNFRYALSSDPSDHKTGPQPSKLAPSIARIFANQQFNP